MTKEMMMKKEMMVKIVNCRPAALPLVKRSADLWCRDTHACSNS